MIGPSHNLLPYTSFAAPGHRRGALSLTRGYEAEVVQFGEPAAEFLVVRLFMLEPFVRCDKSRPDPSSSPRIFHDTRTGLIQS